MKLVKLFLLLFLLVGCNSTTYEKMSMDEGIARYQESEHAVLLDVRTVEEYKTGYILNAINIPHESIEDVKEIIEDKDQMIFVYCRSGNRSQVASKALVDMGYTNVIEIGGIMSYQGELNFEN